MCDAQELYLSDNKIGDPGIAALARALGTGALAQLSYLALDGNQIGDLTALATECVSGALASLQTLSLSRNLIGDVGTTALADILAADPTRWTLPSLLYLRLDQNAIGDAGISSLADALGTGALRTLLTLWVDSGPLGKDHPKLTAVCGKYGIERIGMMSTGRMDIMGGIGDINLLLEDPDSE